MEGTSLAREPSCAPAADGSRLTGRKPVRKKRREPNKESDDGAPQGEIELRIDSLAAGGDGVGRADDGRVVFVPFTAPGDRVRVEIRSKHTRFAHGRVVSLLDPGPGRTDPICPVFGSCGGCAWQHVEYEVQLSAKVQILSDALARLGGTRPTRCHRQTRTT